MGVIDRILKLFGIEAMLVSEGRMGFRQRNGRIDAILPPGRYWSTPFSADALQTVARSPEELPDWAEALLIARPELAGDGIVKVTVPETAVGLLRRDGRLVAFLAPGRQGFYWRDQIDQPVEMLALPTDRMIDPPLAETLRLRFSNYVSSILFKAVPEGAVGLLTIGGTVARVLPPGLHAAWKFGQPVEIETVELRQQLLDVAGQEILTRDKVTIRVNLTIGFRIADPLLGRRAAQSPIDWLYKQAQFALREAYGARTLDAALAEKSAVGEEVAAALQAEAEALGFVIEMVGVKDIILPGEMRELMNKVVEAEKQAQANIIRRREETAATRALLNTAKLLEENPLMLRLKEMEAAERIVENAVQVKLVVGGDKGIVAGLIGGE